MTIVRLNAPVHVGDASEHSVNWSAPVFFAAAKKRPFRPRLLASLLRLATTRASGMRMSSPTIATTTTMTTTFGSLKFWPPTTGAAAILRCAVPNASTPFVPRPGPPRNYPEPKPPMRKRMLAEMPRVPNKSTIFPIFVARSSTIISARLRVEALLSRGPTRAATAL